MSKNLGSSTYKIGIDIRLWNETGVGRYIRNLVRELQELDSHNEYVLFVRSKDKEAVQLVLYNKKWSVRIADMRWHTVAEQLELPKMLQKEQLDLVHFPYFSVPIFYQGAYVLTIHDVILHHFPTGKASTHSWFVYRLKHMAYSYVISQAAKHAQKILTVSAATKKEIIEDLHVPQEKITVTYEGVDAVIAQKKSTKSYDTERFFLYVGNAYPHKNVERLLDAFSTVFKNDASVKLFLVGKEDYFYKRLKERVEQMHLKDAVVFMHNISDGQLAGLYEHALSLVMPSLMEGFGLPVLEAMARGCLVVTSDIPVFREIAKDIPLYFDPTDTHSLANVLESIAKGRVTDAKERKGKGKLQAKHFSWKEMAKETLAVYKSSTRV